MRIACLTVVLLLAGCGEGAGATYTLYRSAILGSADRVHVATFDAKESSDYNQINCETTRGLYQSQPGVTVRYWCERGRYRR